jgi:uncharacterized membrane protein
MVFFRWNTDMKDILALLIFMSSTGLLTAIMWLVIRCMVAISAMMKERQGKLAVVVQSIAGFWLTASIMAVPTVGLSLPPDRFVIDSSWMDSITGIVIFSLLVIIVAPILSLVLFEWVFQQLLKRYGYVDLAGHIAKRPPESGID